MPIFLYFPAPATIPVVPFSPAPDHYWNMDSIIGGTTIEDQVGSRDITISGAIALSSNSKLIRNNVYVADPAVDFTMETSVSGPAAFSINIWFNYQTLPNIKNYIFRKGDSRLQAWLTAGGGLRSYDNRNIGPTNPNTWHMMTLHYNGVSDSTFWLDGVRKLDITGFATPGNTLNFLQSGYGTIDPGGATPTATDTQIGARIDEVGYWYGSAIASDGIVLNLYNRGLAATPLL